jgi:hypothetical protein
MPRRSQCAARRSKAGIARRCKQKLPGKAGRQDQRDGSESGADRRVVSRVLEVRILSQQVEDSRMEGLSGC